MFHVVARQWVDIRLCTISYGRECGEDKNIGQFITRSFSGAFMSSIAERRQSSGVEVSGIHNNIISKIKITSLFKIKYQVLFHLQSVVQRIE